MPLVRIKNKWTHLTIGAPIAIGGATGELLGRKVIGIGGPYIGAIIGNTVSGAVGGGVSGAISGGINAVFVNESDKEAFSEAVKGVLRGAANGALFGAISGAASGFIGGTDGGAVSRDAAIVAVTLTLGTFAQSQILPSNPLSNWEKLKLLYRMAQFLYKASENLPRLEDNKIARYR